MINDIIKVKNVSKRFGNNLAVDNITFSVKRGEIFGLIGPNGAGKTTTINMLTTLLRPSSGEIEINGFRHDKEPDKIRENIALVQQKPYALDWFLTPEQNISYYMKFHGIRDKRFIKQKTERIIKQFDLEKYSKEQVYTLSGGIQRRIMVARAFASGKQIVFLDEPTVGLDPIARIKTLEYIKDINNKNGTTILLTSHYLQEIEYLCHNVAIIKNGKIIVQGTPFEIRSEIGDIVLKISIENSGNISIPVLELEKYGLKYVKEDNNVYYFGISDINQSIDALSYIKSIGLVIRGLELSKPTLEDVFIKLLKEN